MTSPERPTQDHRHDEVEDHDRGLLFDMQRLVGRRRALAWVGGTALAALAGYIRAYGFTSVLDVGCGTGRAMLNLREVDPALRLTGVEPVAELREDAIRRGIHPDEIIDGDATRLPFGDDEFDCVCAFGVLHHVPDPEAAITEMFRVARRAVYISDLNNYGCGSTAQRVVSHSLRTLRLWRTFQYLKNGRKHWKYDEEGDGLFYSYSLFDSLPFIRSKAESTYLVTTNDTAGRPLWDATHVAVLALAAPERFRQAS